MSVDNIINFSDKLSEITHFVRMTNALFEDNDDVPYETAMQHKHMVEKVANVFWNMAKEKLNEHPSVPWTTEEKTYVTYMIRRYVKSKSMFDLAFDELNKKDKYECLVSWLDYEDIQEFEPAFVFTIADYFLNEREMN